MAQRGRKSTASLSVVQLAPGQKRPDPPAELTEEEAEEWVAVVGRLPPEWFTREMHAQLVNYCRHVVKARVIAGMIHGFRPELMETDGDLVRLDKLTHMAERESRAIASLGTKMRITQQSRMKENTAGRKAADAGAGYRPWATAAKSGA